MGVKDFSGAYRGRRVLVTGHTGFKGSWLALWLTELGATVAGLSLPPEPGPNHWDLLALDIADNRYDVRDFPAVLRCMQDFQPEIVFHLAAQPLVRRSYRDPLETWSSNVMGTANLLEACRKTDSIQAVVVITTDKVYRNNEWPWGYREEDRLGGHDPYAASKAAAEIVVDSYRKAFFAERAAPILLASARAGNVIAGGDWSEDRLIPDLVRALHAAQPLEIRSPASTRPWQHVLDCLSGYLQLGQRLLQGEECFAEAWNFGPAESDNRSVADILSLMQKSWPELVWRHGTSAAVHEARLLYLDSAKARSALAWHPVWPLETALHHTADWYRTHGRDGSVISRQQLAAYIVDAKAAAVSWVN